jgi:hypothetical protein
MNFIYPTPCMKLHAKVSLSMKLAASAAIGGTDT